MIILLLGVPAAGKTTLGRSLHDQGLIEYVGSGEQKKEMLTALNIRKHLSQFNQTESILINAFYFESLWKAHAVRYHLDILLVDTHATYGLPDGSFVNLLPYNTGAKAVILLEATAPTIRERRISRGRDRDSVIDQFISYELDQERLQTLNFCNNYGLPLLTIDNSDDWKYDEIVKFIKRIARAA